MPKYIDADKFVEKERSLCCADCERRKNRKGKFIYGIGEAPCRACWVDDMIDEIENAPDADVQEVKHGKWGKSSFPNMLMCTKCGIVRNPNFKVGYGDWNFCPNCGAKMDLKESEE